MPAWSGHNILLFTVYFLLSTAAKPLPLRDHFHEFSVEALIPIDVLRRGGVDVITV